MYAYHAFASLHFAFGLRVHSVSFHCLLCKCCIHASAASRASVEGLKLALKGRPGLTLAWCQTCILVAGEATRNPNMPSGAIWQPRK